jgi:hypothetical protein
MEFADAVKVGKKLIGSEMLALWCVLRGLYFDKDLERNRHYIDWACEMERAYMHRKDDCDLSKIEWIRKQIKNQLSKK